MRGCLVAMWKPASGGRRYTYMGVEGLRHPNHAEAFWSAVAQMHGASLHRSYRFREVENVLRPKPAIQPAKAASRPGLPHALQDASRSRWQFAKRCQRTAMESLRETQAL